jgi:hypothetical protein
MVIKMNKKRISVFAIVILILASACTVFLSVKADNVTTSNNPSTNPPNWGGVIVILRGVKEGMPGAEVTIDCCNCEPTPDDSETIVVEKDKLGRYTAHFGARAGEHTLWVDPVVDGYKGDTDTVGVIACRDVRLYLDIAKSKNRQIHETFPFIVRLIQKIPLLERLIHTLPNL